MSAMMRDVMSEPTDDTRWAELQDEVSRLEDGLVALTRCLQKERECVTLFDIAGLMSTIGEKDRVLSMLEDRASERVAVFEAAWDRAGLGEDMPEDVPTVLETMADSAQCHDIRTWLRDRSSELMALMDVVTELQSLNRALVGRAMQWVNAYVAELSGGSGTYNAKGRVVNRTRGTLARSI